MNPAIAVCHLFSASKPRLYPGEPLLVQLVKEEARKQGKEHARINFALIFDHLVRDYDGSISRSHWPAEKRVWDWIIYASATVPTVPFSLEDLGLSRAYDGQTNPQYIDSADEEIIRPYLQWALAEEPQADRQLVLPQQLVKQFGAQQVLVAIKNHDRIIERRSAVPTRVVQVEQFVRNEWLAESIKSCYTYRCQICGHSFQPDYGINFIETHHIHYLAQGGKDISTNMAVVCPNHHRIIHATDARFHRETLTYEYPNGLRELLLLPDHFKDETVRGL